MRQAKGGGGGRGSLENSVYIYCMNKSGDCGKMNPIVRSPILLKELQRTNRGAISNDNHDLRE